MTPDETQHFEPESLISGGSGKSQDADSEYSTDWAFNENEYDASGSGEQEEMERDSETGVCHLLCLKLQLPVYDNEHLSFILNAGNYQLFLEKKRF